MHARFIGITLIRKYRVQAIESGYFQAARNLRKQGFSLGATRLILLGRVG